MRNHLNAVMARLVGVLAVVFVCGVARATDYYLIGNDAINESSLSGTGNAGGWATVAGGTSVAVRGMTAGNSYFVATNESRSLRTPPEGIDYATLAPLTVLSGARFGVNMKMAGNKTLTLKDFTLEENAVLSISTSSDGLTHTLAGNWACGAGSSIIMSCSANSASDIRQLILGATLTGTGRIVAYPASQNAADGARVNKITGNLSGWTGDVSAYAGFGKSLFTLEVVNASSIPADADGARVTVTNGATLKVDVDWTSSSRAWDFGASGNVPTIEVASGKTVTIRGPVFGSVGLKKTGSGTLSLAAPGQTPITIVGTGSIDAETLAAYAAGTQASFRMSLSGATYTWTGSAITPTVTVTEPDGTTLVDPSNYDLVFTDNVGPGIATVTVTGKGTHSGTQTQSFRIAGSRAHLASFAREVEYAQGDGTAYLDLGTKLTQADAVELTLMECVNQRALVFGSRTSSSANDSFLFGYDSDANDAASLDFYNGSAGRLQITPKASGLKNMKLHIINRANLRRFVFADTDMVHKETTSAVTASFTSPRDIWLFGASGDVWSNTKFAGRIYDFEIIRNGAARMNLVPVKRTTDDLVGMYDLVSGAFFTNVAASGALIAGPLKATFESAAIPDQVETGAAICPDPIVTNFLTGAMLEKGTDYTLETDAQATLGAVELRICGKGDYAGMTNRTTFVIRPVPRRVALPAAYRQIEYLQGDGAGTRILTDYTPAPQTDRIEVTASVERYDKSAALSCSRGSSSTASTYSLWYATQSSCHGALEFDYNNSQAGKFASGRITTGVVFRVTAEANGASWSSGSEAYAYTDAPSFTAAGGPAMLFASYSNGTGSNLGNYSNHKLYGYKVWRSGVLIRDLVPVVRRADGVAGLYCLKTRVFYKNAGSGTFVQGAGFTGLQVLPIAAQPYLGAAVEPSVTVIDAATGAAVSSSDYTVAYTDNTSVGTGTATMTGKAGTDYEGQSASVPFAILKVYRVTDFTLAEEGTGDTWGSPMSFTNALRAASVAGGELWLKSGTLTYKASCVSTTLGGDLVIRGGFAGTEASSAERTDGVRTKLDGVNTYDLLKLVSGAASAIVLDRLDLARATTRALNLSGAADLTVRDCAFLGNGRSTNGSGKGANLSGNGYAVASFTNCVFGGNMRTSAAESSNHGAGLYISSYARLELMSCTFATNGMTYAAQNQFVQQAYGAAIYANATPIQAAGCRFAGNGGACRYDSDGGTVRLNGACGGSVFRNCAFVGNHEVLSYQPGTSYRGGALVVELSAVANTVELENCTFAYNMTRSYYGAGGLNVVKGTANIRNSLFYGNKRYNGGTAGIGADLYLQSNGRANVSYTWFTSNDLDRVSAVTTGALVRDHVYYGNPLLVTSDATAKTAMDSNSSYGASASMDAHLVSSGGYMLNDGSAGPATDLLSLAIDAGDPTSDYANEPSPNGGRLNLGAYGNTAEASQTPTGAAQVDAFGVTYPDGLTRPVVTLTMGLASGVGYNAKVTLVCTNGSETVATKVYENVHTGDTLVWKIPYYFDPDLALGFTYTVEVPGCADLTDDKTATTTGEKPIFADKCGGANVVHVRAGADCLMDGSDWCHAYPDLETALVAAIADPTKNEIWVATNTFKAAAVLTLPHTFALRGGFLGWETSPAARPAGTVTTISNAGVINGLDITGSSGNDFTLERFVIKSTSTRALKKSGAGNFTCFDCAFLGNGRGVNAAGRGVHAVGTSATTIAFTNCQFEGNMRSSAGENIGYGAGAYLETFKRVYLTDCTFITNGICRSSLYPTYAGGWRASALYLTGAPVTAVRTRFAGHCNSIRSDGEGGAVWLNGSCGGSAFTNCTWVGGGDWLSYQGGDSSSYAAALVVNLGSVASKVDLKNCTIAYNTTCSKSSAPGMSVVCGTVKATDSIFYGNVRGNANATVGADIDVKSNGRLTLDHVLLTSTNTTAFTYTSAANVTLLDVIEGDPLFVHGQDVFLDTLSSSGNYKYPKVSAAAYAGATTLDVHLKSAGGYYLNSGAEGPFTALYSPAIDKGRSDSDYANEPDPNGACVNLGAYGNTSEASKSVIPAAFTIDPVETQIFEGSALTPSITIRNIETGEVLPNSDFNITYAGNDRAGNAAITVKGKSGGSYDGQTAYQTFIVIGRVYVTVDAEDDGDGKSWATAMPWVKAFEYGCLNGAEIWMKGGTYTLATSATNMTVATVLIVRGGFAGNETSREQRSVTNDLSIIDGGAAKETMLIKNGVTAPVTLDRIVLTRSSKRGLYKEGPGDLTLKDCTISMNARSVALSGRGLYAIGGSTATIVITNCVFSDNMYNGYAENAGAAGGSHFDGCKRVYLTHCRYFRNGHLWMSDWGSFASAGQGSAIYAASSPLTVNRCRFAGNSLFVRYEGQGGCVRLVGASGGSAFTNCAFIANGECRSYQPGTSDAGGALSIALNAKADKVDVINCTFAYNVSGADQCAAGMTVIQGTANVRNSIFYKNMRGQRAACAFGNDICLKGNGVANIAHTLVTSTDVDSVTSVTVGSLTWDLSNIYSFDPLFVTDTNTFQNVLSWNSDKSVCWLNTGKASEFSAFDVHLLSKGGYFVNGGAEGNFTEITSDAIDAGDPASDYSQELTPNGYRVNLGAYGNSDQASHTTVGQPRVDGFSVEFPDNKSRPHVTLEMGMASGVDYNAKVSLVCATNGITVATAAFQNVHNGAIVTWKVPEYFPYGRTIRVSYKITAESADTLENYLSREVDGELPASYGRGGGTNVIHVMEGADCRMNGANWIDAYPDFASAIAEASTNSAKTEIWICKKTDYASVELTRTASLAIRGGFTGTENRASERPSAGRTIFDNGLSRNGISIVNGAGAAVTLDRVEINRSLYRALKKTGSGDLVLNDCAFRGNGRANNSAGKGIYATGGGVAYLVCSNCVFEGNMLMWSSESSNYGGGAYIASFVRATLDNCTFTTNGICYGAGGADFIQQAPGAAIYADATPITARFCRFAGNASATRYDNDGGTVRLSGACGGSAFTNCLWIGNTDRQSYQPGACYRGGALVVDLSSVASTVDLKNCTVAYNLSDGLYCAGGLNVVQGTVTAKDSIFYGNIRGYDLGNTGSGSDVKVQSNGRFRASYSAFTATNAPSVYTANAANVTLTDVYAMDPLFVSSNETVTALLRTAWHDVQYYYFRTDAVGYRTLATLNAHLKGNAGYVDENTGKLVYFRRVKSPAVDAGDPKSDWKREYGDSGLRINLGCYGNTPWATQSHLSGLILRVR